MTHTYIVCVMYCWQWVPLIMYAIYSRYIYVSYIVCVMYSVMSCMLYIVDIYVHYIVYMYICIYVCACIYKY